MLRSIFAGLCAVVASSAAVLAADLTISSPAFADKGQMAAKYSCDGEGVSPPLVFANVPPRTASLALIVEDPDIPEQFKSQVPGGVFDHWVHLGHRRRQQGLRGRRREGRHQRRGRAGLLPRVPARQGAPLLLQALRSGHEARAPPSRARPICRRAMAGHILQQAAMIGMYGPSVGKK